MTLFVNKSQTAFGFWAGVFIVIAGVAVFTEQYLLAIIPFALLLFFAGWQNMNIVFLLLLIALPFSFEYNFSSGLGTDIPDEFLMLFVTLLFFAYWLYSPSVLGTNVMQHPLLLFLLISTCWIFIAATFSTHQQISFKYLLAKGWYIGAFVLAPLIAWKEKKIIIKRNLRVLLAGAIIIALIALFFSYSRGAWLALVAGIIAYWLIKKRLLFYSYIAAIALTITLLFWIKGNDRYLRYAHDYKTTIFHQDFSDHLISTYKLKDVSTAERFYRWIAGVRMIKDNWLTGYGPNTFYENYKGYAVPAYKTWVSDNPERSTVHNYFLLMAIEQGIPGLIFFLLLLGAMVYYAQHLYHRVKDLFYKTLAAVTGVIITMIIVLNFLSDLVETDKVGSLFFLCFTMLIIIDSKTSTLSNLSPDIQRIS